VLLHALKVKELVPDDFGLDFSRGSLERLEAVAVQRTQTSQDTPLDVPGRSFDASVTAYLGESLLRVAGGCWGWDDQRGVPAVVPDPKLGLPPLTPRFMLLEAVKERTGGVFVRTFDLLRAHVGARYSRDPDWAPERVQTPFLDPLAPDGTVRLSPEHPRRRNAPDAADRIDPLELWLEFLDMMLENVRMPDNVPADFSPTSLAAYEALLLQRYRDPRSLAHAGRNEWVDTDIAYVGETVSRLTGGHWDWDDQDIGGPVVVHDAQFGLPATSPFSLMMDAVRDGGGGVIARAVSELQQLVDAAATEPA